MEHEVKLYNSLSREKETFKPIQEGHIGFYVCGPTVYSNVHLGNCRTFVSFDVMYRYLMHVGYKVRYVRNITDVGHLLDDGEDRMLKKARTDNLEPMEVAQKYTIGFHEMMDIFNTLPPSIEPRATGHIIEQIDMVKKIIDNGYGYEVNGSVYFDVPKFAKDHEEYGKLSGRVLEDLQSETRDLNKQDEKRNPADFAIWIKADPSHIMRWESPWSVGFPGWHLECSAMSTKYLGEHFDIHGGGNDLKFPHHENEIAQNIGSCDTAPANYWIHTNMLLMNGKKMSKSDGNTISPQELFSGDSEHVSKGYDPIVVRFFMLQTHYRSTLDLSDEALQASEKGFLRLMTALDTLGKLTATESQNGELGSKIEEKIDAIYAELNDDFNTPKALAEIFDIVTIINGLQAGQKEMSEVSKDTLQRLKDILPTIVHDVLGLEMSEKSAGNNNLVDDVMQLVIELRNQARDSKNWDTADTIRDRLAEKGIEIKDGKDGTQWSMK